MSNVLAALMAMMVGKGGTSRHTHDGSQTEWSGHQDPGDPRSKKGSPRSAKIYLSLPAHHRVHVSVCARCVDKERSVLAFSGVLLQSFF
jgi:hypothetical protein